MNKFAILARHEQTKMNIGVDEGGWGVLITDEFMKNVDPQIWKSENIRVYRIDQRENDFYIPDSYPNGHNTLRIQLDSLKIGSYHVRAGSARRSDGEVFWITHGTATIT